MCVPRQHGATRLCQAEAAAPFFFLNLESWEISEKKRLKNK